MTLQRQGVIFCDLDTAVQQHAELVQTHFMTEAVPAGDRVSSRRCTGRCGTVGRFSTCRPGSLCSSRCRRLTAHMTASGMEQSHVLAHRRHASQVTFVEEDVSGSADLPGLHNGVVELYLKAGAQVHVSPGAELEPPPLGRELSTCRAGGRIVSCAGL